MCPFLVQTAHNAFNVGPGFAQMTAVLRASQAAKVEMLYS
jgi:hypothetical protein